MGCLKMQTSLSCSLEAVMDAAVSGIIGGAERLTAARVPTFVFELLGNCSRVAQSSLGSRSDQ